MLGADPVPLDPVAKAVVTQAAVTAIKTQAADLIAKTKTLGPLSATVLQASGGIADALIDGGNEAVWDALTSTLAIGAGEVCAETGAGLAVSPLCVYIGQQVGAAIKYTFADPPAGPPTLLQSHNDRFYAVYNALLAEVPDDRGAKLSKFNSVYERAAAQLAVICHLWTDGVSFASTGGVSGAVGFYVGPTVKDKGMTDYAPPGQAGGEPTSMLVYGPGEPEGWADVWPMLQNKEAEWFWVCTTFSWAFGNVGEPLPEFRTGCQASKETAAARAMFWDFSRTWTNGKLDHATSKAFKNAARRILLAARVETEWRFNNNVQALAHAIQDKLLPLCEGSSYCTGAIIPASQRIAHSALMTARGLPLEGGTPQEIVDRGIKELVDTAILVAESHVLDPAEDNRAFEERRKQAERKKAHGKAVARARKTTGAAGKRSQEGDAGTPAPSGLTLGRAVLGGAVALGVGAVGLGAVRAASGLRVVPRTWKPKGWLK